MIATHFLKYSDGTYSATTIEHSKEEGETCSKYLADMKDGKVRFIGELRCFDENGNYRVFKNLQSEQFRK